VQFIFSEGLSAVIFLCFVSFHGRKRNELRKVEEACPAGQRKQRAESMEQRAWSREHGAVGMEQWAKRKEQQETSREQQTPPTREEWNEPQATSFK